MDLRMFLLVFLFPSELKAQLAKEELRKQRLVEAFKKTSQEFRETCYQLLGYKIDMPCTGQYRLASMYSESPHDYLLFKVGHAHSSSVFCSGTDHVVRLVIALSCLQS